MEVDPQWLRYKYTKRVKFWQIHRYFTNPPVIEDGGWHFSFIMKPDAIRDKIKSFAHTEFNKPEFTNLEEIEKKIISKKDLFGRNFKFKILSDKELPEYIINNKEKFSDFLI